MAQFTIADLTEMLRECAGVDEGVDLTADILDVPFEDLGYDSLALLNTTGKIERELSIKLSDATLAEATTPRLLLARINQHSPQTVR